MDRIAGAPLRPLAPKPDAERFDLKTEATLRVNGEVVLIASTDETGAYLHVPKESVSLPPEVLRHTLERAGILPSSAAHLLGVGAAYHGRQS